MLLQLLATEIEQRCDVCGARRRLALDALQAGVEDGDPPEPVDPNVIVLPPCTGCGAQEFLNRVTTAPRDALDDGAEHRRAVNAVHAALVGAGRVAPAMRDYFATENLDTERARVPWSFPGEPVPIVGRPDPVSIAFAEFVARRHQASGGP